MKITTAKGKVKDINDLKPLEHLEKAYQLAQQAPIETLQALILLLKNAKQGVVDSSSIRQLLKGALRDEQIREAEKVVGALPPRNGARRRNCRVTNREIAAYLRLNKGTKISADYIGKRRQIMVRRMLKS